MHLLPAVLWPAGQGRGCCAVGSRYTERPSNGHPELGGHVLGTGRVTCRKAAVVVKGSWWIHFRHWAGPRGLPSWLSACWQGCFFLSPLSHCWLHTSFFARPFGPAASLPQSLCTIPAFAPAQARACAGSVRPEAFIAQHICLHRPGLAWQVRTSWWSAGPQHASHPMHRVWLLRPLAAQAQLAACALSLKLLKTVPPRPVLGWPVGVGDGGGLSLSLSACASVHNVHVSTAAHAHEHGKLCCSCSCGRMVGLWQGGNSLQGDWSASLLAASAPFITRLPYLQVTCHLHLPRVAASCIHHVSFAS